MPGKCQKWSESVEDGARFYASGALNRANGRRVFVQRSMRSDVVIIGCVRSQDPSQMASPRTTI
jgi:hypothetical protein